MYTKLLIQIQCVLLTILTVISVIGLITGDLNFVFEGWVNTWLGISFLVVYGFVFVFSICQVLFGLLEGRVFGVVSGSYSALCFVPFVCFLIIPVNVWFLYKRLNKSKM
jgi:uncharacterized membrane protein